MREARAPFVRGFSASGEADFSAAAANCAAMSSTMINQCLPTWWRIGVSTTSWILPLNQQLIGKSLKRKAEHRKERYFVFSIWYSYQRSADGSSNRYPVRATKYEILSTKYPPLSHFQRLQQLET